MEQHLFVLLLFTGVCPLILPVPRYYHLIQEEKSWDDARAYCRHRYTDLATIDSDEDMTKLQQVVQAHKFSSGAWIGLYTNINSWYWSFNNESLGSFRKWVPGFPLNEYGNDQCVYIQKNGWWDAPCSWRQYSVCFNETKTGADRYILIFQKKTWDKAQSYCRQHYTDLVSIRNATENSVIGALQSSHYVWFGLRRDPVKWSDETSDVSFIRWSGGDSMDYRRNKSCGFLSKGVADAAQCDDIKPFFCYSHQFPDRQQIIKVKVSSREDVNDPTVMVAILEKIEQKLKDQGLYGNITVKWREQPDKTVAPHGGE